MGQLSDEEIGERWGELSKWCANVGGDYGAHAGGRVCEIDNGEVKIAPDGSVRATVEIGDFEMEAYGWSDYFNSNEYGELFLEDVDVDLSG